MADATQTAQNKTEEPEFVPATASKDFVWHGKDGQTVNYTATAEMVDIHEDKGDLIGHMFCLSFVSDAADKSDRPVTFLWNGGPGGSSAMVCIGGMGPKRIVPDGMNHIKNTQQPEDNPYSLLPSSDLVFIDALGTGYSHVAKGYDAKKVWGVDGDADAFARAIIAWLMEHDRMDCPHYLYGESYGTMRNAVVYRLLGERSIGVDGVIEQSSILDYAPTLSGNDAYYLGMFPVYAATARYFKKAGAHFAADDDSEAMARARQTVTEMADKIRAAGVDSVAGAGVTCEDEDEAQAWFDAAIEYADETLSAALVQGDNLPEERLAQVATEMSAFIGLPAELIARRGLRIELDDFRRHIVKDKGLTCGRYDTRFTTYGYEPVQGDNEFFAGEDPSYDALQVAWNQAYQKYVSGMIGFKGYPNYVGLALNVNASWNWTHQAPGTMGAPQTPNVAFDIATALRRNPTSRIFFSGGRHDAATPFWNVRHDMAKLFLPAELKSRIEYHVHPNGHMAYADAEALEALAGELAAFYEKRHEA